ncbi:RNA-binding protein [Stappia stellulata]|uniref:RNA-binding protein n=1 Tax=Stappia stellulata TaxID=71235 RepID=UPI001FDEED5E|nr:RNA-binding protein [Stappia stellulata]
MRERETGVPRQNEPLERCCALTREVRPVSQLIRFVAGPDGTVVADLRRRLPGRGVWITATRACVAEAQKKKAFARGFKDASVRVEGDLAAEVDALLERAALNAVSLARKAGEVVSGFSKVEAALRGGDAVIGLIQASDGGDDGTGKLAAIARARFADAGGCRIVRTFESTQLDLALGRSNVIHAALLAGRAAKNALDRIEDLERFRAGLNEASHGGVSDAVIQD